MDVWEKIRRFLLFWLCVLALLIIAAVAVHWTEIAAWTNGQINAIVSTLITLGVVAAIFVLFLGGIFRH